jgi:hypothetical protein
MIETPVEETQATFSEQDNLRHAASLLARNTPREEIVASLMGRGVNEITAGLMVDGLLESRAKAKHSAAIRGLVIGGVLILLGVYGFFAPMLLNPTSSKILAGAAILYGLAQAAQGVILLRK